MRDLLALVLCTCLIAPATAAAETPLTDPGAGPAPPRAEARRAEPHVRPQDPRLADLLRLGRLRSPTLRRLVATIEASNVFVYADFSPQLRPRLAGALTWMSKAGPYRYVRATINPDLPSERAIAALAHELQHAVEVLDDPHVVSERTLLALYRRIGMPSTVRIISGWETEAAQAVGEQVRRELQLTPVGTAAGGAFGALQ